MVQAAVQSPPQRLPLWQGALVLGLCFGLGYGVTQRLLALGLSQFVLLHQSFEVRSFPGTSLDSLRLRFGAPDQVIRVDLERLRLEQQEPGVEQRQRQDSWDQPPASPSHAAERSAAPPGDQSAQSTGLLAPPPPPVLPPPPDSQ